MFEYFSYIGISDVRRRARWLVMIYRRVRILKSLKLLSRKRKYS